MLSLWQAGLSKLRHWTVTQAAFCHPLQSGVTLQIWAAIASLACSWMEGGCWAPLWCHFCITQDVTQASYSMVLPYTWTPVLYPPTFHIHPGKALSFVLSPHLPWISYSSKKCPARNEISFCPLFSDIPYLKLCSWLCNLLGTCGLHVPRDLVSSIQSKENTQICIHTYFSQDFYK